MQRVRFFTALDKPGQYQAVFLESFPMETDLGCIDGKRWIFLLDLPIAL